MNILRWYRHQCSRHPTQLFNMDGTDVWVRASTEPRFYYMCDFLVGESARCGHTMDWIDMGPASDATLAASPMTDREQALITIANALVDIRNMMEARG